MVQAIGLENQVQVGSSFLLKTHPFSQLKKWKAENVNFVWKDVLFCILINTRPAVVILQTDSSSQYMNQAPLGFGYFISFQCNLAKKTD